jgi:hypothetical protein
LKGLAAQLGRSRLHAYNGQTSNSIGMLTAMTSSCTGSPRRQ